MKHMSKRECPRLLAGLMLAACCAACVPAAVTVTY